MKATNSITQRLWQKARDGDRSAYDQLFALHHDRALLFLRARLGPKLRESIDSRDVLQEAYLAAHRDFDRFEWRDEGAFLRWLFRIVERRLADLADHHGAEKRQPVPLPTLDPSGPITRIDRSEHRARVARGLDSLSKDHREVLLHRFFGDLSAAEAGERMQRSAGAVRNLTARALAELARAL